MKWYVAEVIVRCRAGKTSKGKTLYDRQIKVLRASTDEMAYERALKLGSAENHSYKNSAGETISWEFVGLGNLQTLGDKKISDGTEIHSRLERGNPKSEVRRNGIRCGSQLNWSVQPKGPKIPWCSAKGNRSFLSMVSFRWLSELAVLKNAGPNRSDPARGLPRNSARFGPSFGTTPLPISSAS